MKKLFNSKAKIFLISGIIILLIVVFTGFLYCKNTNTGQTVVKMDSTENFKQTVVNFYIPDIKGLSKDSFVDIYIPPALYADRETSPYIQHNTLAMSPTNKLILLPDNKVLYINGANCGSIIFDFNKKIAYTSNSGPTDSDVVLLPDGKVYFYGSRIYNSKLDKNYYLPKMIRYGDFKTVTLLPDQKILLTGGRDGTKAYGDNPLNPENKFSEAEIYDPQLNKYTAVSNMKARRCRHTATLLKNGKVLIVGGNYKNEPYAELFDNKTGKFYPLSYKGKCRYNHTATLLPDGRVLIIGGIDLSGITEDSETKYSDVELFDPKTNKFKEIGKLVYPNWGHSSILLKSNKVLVTGGDNCNQVDSSVCDAQLYDLKTNKTSLVSNASIWQASAIMLKDGNILIVGNWFLEWKKRIRIYIP